jgi:hypothetical protein
MLHNPPVSKPLLYRRSRRRASSQTRIPDWVWGAALGLVVLVFIGGYFLATQVAGGGDGGGCDSPLAPLGTSQISAEAFAAEDTGLGRVLDLLQAGDRAGAEAAFYGPVHNFTHNVDPPLREVDDSAAKALCNEVLNVEELLFNRASDVELIGSIEKIREQLRDAAETLGYPRPGGAATSRLTALFSGVPSPFTIHYSPFRRLHGKA